MHGQIPSERNKKWYDENRNVTDMKCMALEYSTHTNTRSAAEQLEATQWKAHF